MADDIMDLPEFLERVQDDKELLLELLDIFTEDYQKKRLLLGEAINKGDNEQVKSIAHSIKGASGNISAKMLRESFLKLEEAGKTGDLKSAGELLPQIDERYAALLIRMEEVKKKLSC